MTLWVVLSQPDSVLVGASDCPERNAGKHTFPGPFDGTFLVRGVAPTDNAAENGVSQVYDNWFEADAEYQEWARRGR